MKNLFSFIFLFFISFSCYAKLENPFSTIYSDIVSSTGTITTNQTSDTLMTGMTFATPPPAGKYAVDSLTVITASTTTGAIVRTSIYCGGVQSGINSQAIPGFASGAGLGAGTSRVPENSPNKTICTVNGSQNIELRWRTTGGTATSVGRILLIQRLNP